MNETEVKKMLTAAQAYIVCLEKREQELLVKTHELACKCDDLQDANAMLVKSNEDLAKRIDKLTEANTILANSNEDLAAKLNYFRACNDNQANLIIQLRKDSHV